MWFKYLIFFTIAILLKCCFYQSEVFNCKQNTGNHAKFVHFKIGQDSGSVSPIYQNLLNSYCTLELKIGFKRKLNSLFMSQDIPIMKNIGINIQPGNKIVK